MGARFSGPCCHEASQWPSCLSGCYNDEDAEVVQPIATEIDAPENQVDGPVLQAAGEIVCSVACIRPQQPSLEDSANVPGMVDESRGSARRVSGTEAPLELSHLDRSLDVLRARALEPYCKLDSLKDILNDGDIVLIKGSWLIQACRSGSGVLPCRQALPPEAVCVPDDVFRWPVVAVSYCWLTPEHPDTKGKQLGVLTSLMEQFMKFLGHHDGSDVAVFIDWCSLHQEPRSEEEHASFLRSLSHVGIWYAHRETYVWLLSRTPEGVRPYQDRGWPTLERAISQMITPSAKVLDIAQLDRTCRTWERTLEVCQSRGGPPLSPEAFARKLLLKAFTKATDQHMVEKKYRQIFEDVMGSISELNFGSIGWGEEEAIVLAETLPKCERLDYLDLHGNHLGDGGACKLANTITCCARLNQLGLSANRIADKGAIEIASSLPGCRRLQKLDLARNLIGDQGAEKLAEAMQHCPQLQELDLSGNEICEAGAERLAEALPYCQHLGRLGLFENQISNSGAERLADVLPHCRGLQELHLGRNDIGDSGASKLAAVLPNCVNLQNLELGGNEIGDNGALDIAAAIPRCGSLQKLGLARNQIGDMGANRLAEAIPHCRGLQELGLGGNEIGEILGGNRITDGGVEKVAAAIQRCGHLQKLDLSENRIGNRGAAKLAAAIPSCNSLKELNLCGNQISDGGAEELMVAIPQCKRLKTLSLWGNRIGNGSQTQLREAWCNSGKPEQQLAF